MTITRTHAADPLVSHDDWSGMPISAVFAVIEQRFAREMTATVESWLDGLPARAVRRRRGGRRKGNSPNIEPT